MNPKTGLGVAVPVALLLTGCRGVRSWDGLAGPEKVGVANTETLPASPPPAREKFPVLAPTARKPWPNSDFSLERALPHAETVLRAIAETGVEVTKRSGAHLSTAMTLSDGKVIEGGGIVRRAECRQTFRIVDVLRGSHLKQKLVVEYGFVEMSDCFPGPREEMALPVGVEVILLLDEKGRFLKALPYSPSAARALSQPTPGAESEP